MRPDAVKTMNKLQTWAEFLTESSGDLPPYALDIKNAVSKLKKGVAGGTIDLGKTGAKGVSDTDLQNMLREYPDAEVFYSQGHTLLKLKD